MKRGRCGTWTHDDVRIGTTTLFAALEVATGKVTGECYSRHRHQEFLKFLRKLDKKYGSEEELHLVMDSRADTLAFEFEMSLFPAVLDEAKRTGIDIASKIIPPEVFDKRAVDMGQVRFADVAYVEPNPRHDQKDKLTFSIELTDFSVYYSQGIRDELAHGLKEGKSEEDCDAGTLFRVSTDKRGVVTHTSLRSTGPTGWTIGRWISTTRAARRSSAKTMGVEGELPGVVDVAAGEFIEFEERRTDSFIFENEWQSFRTRKDRSLELSTAPHTYPKPGRYPAAVKVIDIFGNDATALAQSPRYSEASLFAAAMVLRWSLAVNSGCRL